MASLITCPHCGVRPKEEFSIRGDASPVRPAPTATDDAWNAYVFLRDNPKGRIIEHWQMKQSHLLRSAGSISRLMA